MIKNTVGNFMRLGSYSRVGKAQGNGKEKMNHLLEKQGQECLGMRGLAPDMESV